MFPVDYDLVGMSHTPLVLYQNVNFHVRNNFNGDQMRANAKPNFIDINNQL